MYSHEICLKFELCFHDICVCVCVCVSIDCFAADNVVTIWRQTKEQIDL